MPDGIGTDRNIRKVVLSIGVGGDSRQHVSIRLENHGDAAVIGMILVSC